MTNEQFNALATKANSRLPQGWRVVKRILQSRKTGIIDSAKRLVIFNAAPVSDVAFNVGAFNVCIDNALRLRQAGY